MTSYASRHAEALAYNEACAERYKTLPRNPSQRFHEGDRVSIGALPTYMSHFRRGNATVKYSYNDMYLNGQEHLAEDVPQYALELDGYGFSAWYPESVLTPIG